MINTELFKMARKIVNIPKHETNVTNGTKINFRMVQRKGQSKRL